MDGAAQRNIPGVGTSFGPSLTSYNGGLYAAWKGVYNDQGIQNMAQQKLCRSPEQRRRAKRPIYCRCFCRCLFLLTHPKNKSPKTAKSTAPKSGNPQTTITAQSTRTKPQKNHTQTPKPSKTPYFKAITTIRPSEKKLPPVAVLAVVKAFAGVT
jgi:hypothetical protein